MSPNSLKMRLSPFTLEAYLLQSKCVVSAVCKKMATMLDVSEDMQTRQEESQPLALTSPAPVVLRRSLLGCSADTRTMDTTGDTCWL